MCTRSDQTTVSEPSKEPVLNFKMNLENANLASFIPLQAVDFLFSIYHTTKVNEEVARNDKKHISTYKSCPIFHVFCSVAGLSIFWNDHYTDIVIDVYNPLVDGCNGVTVSVGHPLEHPPPSKALPLKI